MFATKNIYPENRNVYLILHERKMFTDFLFTNNILLRGKEQYIFIGFVCSQTFFEKVKKKSKWYWVHFQWSFVNCRWNFGPVTFMLLEIFFIKNKQKLFGGICGASTALFTDRGTYPDKGMVFWKTYPYRGTLVFNSLSLPKLEIVHSVSKTNQISRKIDFKWDLTC